MAQWRIKEISDMTKVSVRMLHHYDKICLLKPSVRASNGYRWYVQQDLERLQQIIALKFFGFSLSAIKTLLSKLSGIHEHLCIQQQMLSEQAAHIKQTQDALAKTIDQCKQEGFPDWNSLVKLIERYNMAQELKNTWAGKLTAEEQERYMSLKKEYPKEIAQWDEVIEAINNKRYSDPEGAEGEHAVKTFIKVMNLKKVASLDRPKTSNKEQLDAIARHRNSGVPLNADGNKWLGKAFTAYWLKQWNELYREISNNVEADPKEKEGKEIAQRWIKLIEDHAAAVAAPLHMYIGMTLWDEHIRAKAALQEKRERLSSEQKAAMALEDRKFFLDTKAVTWIAKALSNS